MKIKVTQVRVSSLLLVISYHKSKFPNPLNCHFHPSRTTTTSISSSTPSMPLRRRQIHITSFIFAAQYSIFTHGALFSSTLTLVFIEDRRPPPIGSIYLHCRLLHLVKLTPFLSHSFSTIEEDLCFRNMEDLRKKKAPISRN
ncbi:uncharacterized protein LOC110686896 isoform X2 [Chenopodium quinoa]|uniref:uncharacterized protein LOC110686896 isoform X2 n=1 Tax=Chenopodium quinoa TaxID=63459 RepID=UPI000B773C72|nr:uncharacterized protein LOC110686896 isoform X2 [Chenopodium quinoa]